MPDDQAADQAGLLSPGLATPSGRKRPPAAFWIGLGAFILVNLAWWVGINRATCAAGDSLANPVVAAFVQTCPSPPAPTLPKNPSAGGPTVPWVPIVVNVIAPIALAFTRYRAAAAGILLGIGLGLVLFFIAFIVVAVALSMHG